jgi:uncharacterized protein YfcZ (UPF0381/DUF406 family)
VVSAAKGFAFSIIRINKKNMTPIDIEEIIDNAVNEMLTSVFEEGFSTKQQVELALTYLREKIEKFEADDFEDYLTD